VAVLGVSDRVAFVVTGVTSTDGQSWTESDDELRTRIKEVAQASALR
jgi:hypothetical protein